MNEGNIWADENPGTRPSEEGITPTLSSYTLCYSFMELENMKEYALFCTFASKKIGNYFIPRTEWNDYYSKNPAHRKYTSHCRCARK